MTLLAADSLKRLLLQYTFEVDSDTIHNNLNCIRCGRLTIDCYQTYCDCKYCYECLVAYLSAGGKYCCGGKLDCSDDALVIDENVLRSAVINRQISRLKVVCPNESCTYKSELINMADHIRLCSKTSIDCPFVQIGCTVDSASTDRIMTHIHDDTLAHTQLLIASINNLRNDFENSKLEILSLKTQIRDQSNEIETLKEASRDKESDSASINDVMALFYRLEADIETMKINRHSDIEDDMITFTVDRFMERKHIDGDIKSQYFFSHLNGYKFRLLVDPDLCLKARGQYLAATICLYKGEYDDQLTWPCQCSFTIGIFNQTSEEIHSSETFSYLTSISQASDYKSSFERPTAKRNSGCGYYIMFYDTLQSVSGLLVNDSVVFKCSVAHHL